MAYDWSKREPLHCAAESSRLWELTQLLGHYHPSVVQFAASVSRGEPISYAGDPLRDFGLMSPCSGSNPGLADTAMLRASRALLS